MSEITEMACRLTLVTLHIYLHSDIVAVIQVCSDMVVLHYK